MIAFWFQPYLSEIVQICHVDLSNNIFVHCCWILSLGDCWHTHWRLSANHNVTSSDTGHRRGVLVHLGDQLIKCYTFGLGCFAIRSDWIWVRPTVLCFWIFKGHTGNYAIILLQDAIEVANLIFKSCSGLLIIYGVSRVRLCLNYWLFWPVTKSNVVKSDKDSSFCVASASVNFSLLCLRWYNKNKELEKRVRAALVWRDLEGGIEGKNPKLVEEWGRKRELLLLKLNRFLHLCVITRFFFSWN